MATEVLMPQMGESIAEGTITRWLVNVGDRVERDQPLFEISTDKVDAEIPSPVAGVLLETRGGEGETVAVNEIVAFIGDEGEVLSETPVEVAADVAEGEGADGEAAQEAEVAAVPEELETRGEGSREVTDTGESDEAERVRTASSPVVRKIAAEHDVDITTVTGSGIHGRVTKKDILAYIEARGAAGEAPASPATEVVAATVRRPVPEGFYVAPYTEGERVEIEPMSKIRQITSAHMTYSKATSAHVTTVFHMDLSKVYRRRNDTKNAFLQAYGTKLTYMPFIFKAVATALKAHPKLNASVDGTDIVFKKDINIGMAVALDWGLLVPVIRHADELNLVGLARTANDLADRARNKKLSPDELNGGTFTVTNPGVFGSLFGIPIINPYFAITYDHRLVDGADADQFMNHIKSTLIGETWGELDAF
jgi:2-oxoglutarate dehydrogenase E2 component (dihydrolipoamide succinyltransferase)